MSEWRDLSDSPLPATWGLVPLESLCAGIFDCPHSTPKITEEGFYLVRTPDIIKGKLDLSKTLKVTSETYADRIKRAKPEAGDLLFSREGTYFGIAATIPKGIELCLGQRMVLMKPSKEILSDFVKYWINSPIIKRYLHGSRAGSVAERLNLPTIRKLPTAVPPLPEQHTIVSVLSGLDDKIDLLHRQNKTLEAMAETLFRQWFVEEADERWEETPLSKIADHIKMNIQPQNNKTTLYHHYSLPAFDDKHQPIIEMGAEIQSNKYKVFPNTILISKLNPRFPRVWAIPSSIDENSICSTEFQVVSSIRPEWRSFIYCLLKSKQVIDELVGSAGGTSGSHQRVKPEDIFNIKFRKPDHISLRKFNMIVNDCLPKLYLNYQSIALLEKMRDNLLPKLMSGEVRVAV